MGIPSESSCCRQETIRQQLSQCDIFTQLDTGEQSSLLSEASVCAHSAGNIILRQGQSVEEFYIVLSGEVAMWKSRPSRLSVDMTSPASVSAHSSQELESTSCLQTPSATKRYSDCEKEVSSLASTASGGWGIPSLPSSASSTTREPGATRPSSVKTGFGFLMAMTGQGSLIGESALRKDSKQDATITCVEDCQLLVVKKDAFEMYFRQKLEEQDEIQSAQMHFLRKFVPGMQDLSQEDRFAAAKQFQKKTFPAGHVFFEQGERVKKVLYVIAHGSVGRYCRDISKFSGLPVPGLRKQSKLAKGDLFGSLGAIQLEPFTLRCTKPCEVFCISGEGLKKLPKALLVSMRQHLARDAARHHEQNEAIPTSPSHSPKRLGRSLRSQSIALSCSAAQMPAALPRACKIESMIAERHDGMWNDEVRSSLHDAVHQLHQALQANSMPSTQKPPVHDRSFCKQRSRSDTQLSCTTGALVLPQIGPSQFPLEKAMRTPIIGPFMERRRAGDRWA